MIIHILAASLYALVGAPSSGKTSIINELKNNGRIVAEESASDVILEEQAKGDLTPWLTPGFEIKVFEKKVERESAAISLADQYKEQAVFTDRGLLDTLVYLEVLNKKETKEFQEIITRIEETNAFNRYTAIFYIEPHSSENFSCEIEGARHEETHEALQIGSLLKEVYLSTGKTLFFVPPDLTPKERAHFIESCLQLENRDLI